MERTSIVPASESRSKVMSTELMAIGCASGISYGVCFAASTPATFAVVSTSPFGSARSIEFLQRRRAHPHRRHRDRFALRARFAPTSTMEMPPVSSR